MAFSARNSVRIGWQKELSLAYIGGRMGQSSRTRHRPRRRAGSQGVGEVAVVMRVVPYRKDGEQMTERTLDQWCLACGGPVHLEDPKMSEGLEARKVLVVDDEPDVEPMFRQRMRREVRAGMYEFLLALSGRHALEV